MAVDMVLSIIATDRPGLVQTLSELLVRHQGNWVDSSMARLGSDFAGIVRVTVPETEVEPLKLALAALGEDGIAVTVRKGSKTALPSGQWVWLELTGGDHPGIMRDISTALSQQGVSIQELKTQIEPASMAGGHLFTAEAWVLLPEGLEIDVLRQELERIASDIMVDISVTGAEERGEL